MGANFNRVQPESISISVYYVALRYYAPDNPIENMWLWKIQWLLVSLWSEWAIAAVTIDCHVMIKASVKFRLVSNWLGLVKKVV